VGQRDGIVGTNVLAAVHCRWEPFTHETSAWKQARKQQAGPGSAGCSQDWSRCPSLWGAQKQGTCVPERPEPPTKSTHHPQARQRLSMRQHISTATHT